MQTNLKNNTNIFERINDIISCYHIKSINEFAIKHLNYKSAEKINRLKKEGKNPSYEILVDILTNFENINADWLLTGRGEMEKATEEISIVNETNESYSLNKTAMEKRLLDFMDTITYLRKENEQLKMELEQYRNPNQNKRSI